jgi:CRISPR-associated protein Cmr1
MVNKTILYCKTTAPLFMAGINKINHYKKDLNPELRATGIKGAMRFVWRAIQCSDNIKELREREGTLFGNAYGGEKTEQSKMRIRIESTRLTKKDIALLPHRNHQDYKGEYIGKDSKTQAFDSEGSFNVVISSFGKTKEDEKNHINYIRLFAITCLIYGFGRRSRKGFGTVEIISITGVGEKINYHFCGLMENLNELTSKVKFEQISNNEIRMTTKLLTELTYPHIERIKIIESEKFYNTSAIISGIGMALHNYNDKNFLGTANPRFASSILLSTIHVDRQYYNCIVTQLYCTKEFDEDQRNTFYGELEGRLGL